MYSKIEDFHMTYTIPSPVKILRLKSVIQKTGLPRSSIYSLMKDKKFPSAIPLGARSVGWLESDINDWIQGRIQESRKS